MSEYLVAGTKKAGDLGLWDVYDRDMSYGSEVYCSGGPRKLVARDSGMSLEEATHHIRRAMTDVNDVIGAAYLTTSLIWSISVQKRHVCWWDGTMGFGGKKPV
jgi:hypothetical protein